MLMIFAPTSQSENNRLAAVRELNILDTPRDPRFDTVTSYVAEKLKAPMSFITFIDKDRQWFKSSFGADLNEIPRRNSICGHAICDITSYDTNDRIYQVYDTKNDIRFFDNPFVANKPWVRSYISFVLQSDSNMNVGTICLLDTKPRIYTSLEKQLLTAIGANTESLIRSCQ